MALDVELLEQQIMQLNRHSAQATDLARALSTYKANLDSAWQGMELDACRRTLNKLILEYEQLADELVQVRRGLFQRSQELRAEQFDGGAQGTAI